MYYLFHVFIYQLYVFITLNIFFGHKILTFIGFKKHSYFFYIQYLPLVLPGGQQTSQGSIWLSETSVKRFSMTAQISDLIKFTSVLKAAMAVSTVFLEGSSSLLSSDSGASKSGVLDASRPVSSDPFFLPFVFTIVKTVYNNMFLWLLLRLCTSGSGWS